MKRWVLSACAAGAMAVGAAQPAEAALVTYSTSGTFGCGTAAGCTVDPSGTVIQFSGGATTTLQYSGVAATRTPPTNISLGSFTTHTGNGADLAGATFTLTVTQIDPLASGNFESTLTGRIVATASSAFVEFSTLSLHLAPYLYTLITADTLQAGQVALNPPGDSSTINAQLTEVAEPASMMLFGTALFGLFGVGRRYSV